MPDILDSYTIEDKNIFFGRDNETEEIFRKLYSGKLVLVYGKSGTGKSSIVNCGLISKIPQEDIFTLNIRCGKRAYDNFVSGIKKYSKAKLDNTVEILEDIFYEHSKPIALIFDQFEEIFILSDNEEREKLAADLNEILKSRLKINIILVIREEFFASLTEFEPFIPGLYENRIRIERMSRSAAKDAIIKPCQVCNVGIEEGLPDKILEHLIVQSDGLELTWLQILMDKMYRIAIERDADNPVIMHDDLIKLGRMGNILSDFLDEQLRQMPNGEMGEAVLKTMISTDGTKKQVNFPDISESLMTTGHTLDKRQIEEILRYFVNVRIITDQDEQGYYELRHDAIAARIYDRMTAIEKELVEIKTFLDNSYKIYEKRKVLLTDNDLNYIAIYESKLILNNELNEFIKLSKKEVQRARQRRRNIVIAAAAALIIIMTGFTIWALNERAKAIEQSKIAEEQKNEAIRANLEAENARLQALEERDKAEENEAIAIEQQTIAEEQRQEAINANRAAEIARQQALDERNRAIENEQLALDARQESENARNEAIRASNEAQFYLYLFNGKELANKSIMMQEDKTLRALLSLAAYDLVDYGYVNFGQEGVVVRYDNEILRALQESYLLFESDSLVGGEIWSIVSQDRKIIFSNKIGELSVSKLETPAKENVSDVPAIRDGVLYLSGIQNQDKLPGLIPETIISLSTRSLVRALAFNDATKQIACGTLDGSVILIDLKDTGTTDQKIVYNHNNNRVLHLAFVPGRSWLISSSTDRTLLVWDLEKQTTITKIQLNEPVQKFVLANPDHLVFVNSTGQILDWELNTIEKEPEIIYNSETRQPFQTLAYNAAHKWFVTTSLGDIIIFPFDPDYTGSLSPERFTVKHKAVVSHLRFSPDNNWLVSASQDAIMLWDLRDIGSKEIDKFVPIIYENNRQVFSATFDEESKYLLYGDNLLMHIHPVDIDRIYTKLKLKMGERELSEQEWKYYIKGDLERPGEK
ncbi:MAG: hypothetical protein AMS27_13015 [Bacteroides sp. SM23_62_1]|nr:MAG: hypothetical protein AMS27_13015 [Bacteroides sp. SM23_62_1]